MELQTADLSDACPEEARALDPLFRHFGGRRRMMGPIRTVKCFEDNTLVRKTLEAPGEGHVLVVDGGGSKRCALLGDRLATLARDHGWAGVVVYGCIRDSAVIGTMDVAVMALATHPRKSIKRGEGQVDVPLYFAGQPVLPHGWLYADEDGILVADRALHTGDGSR